MKSILMNMEMNDEVDVDNGIDILMLMMTEMKLTGIAPAAFAILGEP